MYNTPMPPKRKKRPNVIVSLNLSFESHREVFFGISRLARKLHWRIHFVSFPELFNSSKLQTINADGIITTHYGNKDGANFLMRSSHPLVIIGPREKALSGRKAPTAYVRFNDYNIGLSAGRFLCRLGRFRSAAFICDNSDSELAKSRERGFSSALNSVNIRPQIYNLPNTPTGSKGDIEALSVFFKNLQKPAAVMCVYDKRAADIFEAINSTTIRVPDEMSVISVDNDSLICDFTDPPLTSVAPNYQQLGETAAHILNRMMSKCKSQILNHILKAKKIIDRGSARYIQPSARIVEDAMTFIEKNACKGITAADVAKHLQVSRRLMDLRFRQGTGKSVLALLIERRLETVKDKLKTTDLTIGRITADCGFRSENHAKALFKQHTGLSMRDWRQKNRGSYPDLK